MYNARDDGAHTSTPFTMRRQSGQIRGGGRGPGGSPPPPPHPCQNENQSNALGGGETHFEGGGCGAMISFQTLLWGCRGVHIIGPVEMSPPGLRFAAMATPQLEQRQRVHATQGPVGGHVVHYGTARGASQMAARIVPYQQTRKIQGRPLGGCGVAQIPPPFQTHIRAPQTTGRARRGGKRGRPHRRVGGKVSLSSIPRAPLDSCQTMWLCVQPRKALQAVLGHQTAGPCHGQLFQEYSNPVAQMCSGLHHDKTRLCNVNFVSRMPNMNM